MDKVNYGWIDPVIDENHYVEGDGRLLGASVLNPSGDWEKFIPLFEPQNVRYETFACTIFGLESQVQTVHKYLYGDEPNYDERYNFNLANINPPGSDPQISYETARKNGFISGFLPMTETIEEYRTPRPMTEPYLSEGKKWLSTFFFDHDWVLTGTPNPEKLRTELKKSPLCVSVSAWTLKDGVYIDNDEPNNHWCELYKMDSDYMYIFDSYDSSHKRLPLSHKTKWAKRIVLYKKTPQEMLNDAQKSLIIILLQYVTKLIKKTVRVGGEVITELFRPRY